MKGEKNEFCIKMQIIMRRVEFDHIIILFSGRVVFCKKYHFFYDLNQNHPNYDKLKHYQSIRRGMMDVTSESLATVLYLGTLSLTQTTLTHL